MTGNVTINIGRQYSRYPLGRYQRDGAGSGEEFRKVILEKILQGNPDKVVIQLDDALGYGSSFLDEAFGGLVRSGYPKDRLLTVLEFESEDYSLIEEIRDYIRGAKSNA